MKRHALFMSQDVWSAFFGEVWRRRTLRGRVLNSENPTSWYCDVRQYITLNCTNQTVFYEYMHETINGTFMRLSWTVLSLKSISLKKWWPPNYGVIVFKRFCSSNVTLYKIHVKSTVIYCLCTGITVYEFTVEYCQNGSNVRSTLLVENHCNFQCIVERNTITNYVM